jgi:UDP-N-acetylglucosamine 2-epimerase
VGTLVGASVRVLCVFGTRPEAIKMAPVIRALRECPAIDLRLCLTGQHRDMVDQVLRIFDVRADHEIHVMRPGQSLGELTAALLNGLGPVIDQMKPHRILVHGDTSSTLGATLAAYYARVPVAHVEAGLRTGDIFSPWPEEVNRKVVSAIADLHFAPTVCARDNLLAENIANERIVITGNTVIDALLHARDILNRDDALRCAIDQQLPPISADRRLLLVTGHRRESFGDGFVQICHALRRLAERPDLDILYPVHPNPNVREPVERLLGDVARIRLIEPLDYLPFVRLLDRASVVLTDSGGLQEEAPTFGKPVLVMRETTERPEALHAGTARLVGTDSNRIVAAVTQLLDDPIAYAAMTSATNPYGDGLAAARISARLRTSHGI